MLGFLKIYFSKIYAHKTNLVINWDHWLQAAAVAMKWAFYDNVCTELYAAVIMIRIAWTFFAAFAVAVLSSSTYVLIEVFLP